MSVRLEYSVSVDGVDKGVEVIMFKSTVDRFQVMKRRQVLK